MWLGQQCLGETFSEITAGLQNIKALNIQIHQHPKALKSKKNCSSNPTQKMTPLPCFSSFLILAAKPPSPSPCRHCRVWAKSSKQSKHMDMGQKENPYFSFNHEGFVGTFVEPATIFLFPAKVSKSDRGRKKRQLQKSRTRAIYKMFWLVCLNFHISSVLQQSFPKYIYLAFKGLLELKEKARVSYEIEHAKVRLSKLNNAVGRPATTFTPGALVMLWRQKMKPGKAVGHWQGPVRVLLQEGSTVWTASTNKSSKNHR